MDKFIYTQDEQLKDELVQLGYKSLAKSGDFFILENNPKLKFNFSTVDKSRFILSNKLNF